MRINVLVIIITSLFSLTSANRPLDHDWKIPKEKLSQEKRTVDHTSQFSEESFSSQEEGLQDSVSQGIFFTNEDLEKKLYSFNKALKEFVSEEGFDFIEFEIHIEEIRNEISDIEFLAETELNDPELTRKVTFARQMFSSMVDSTDKLKRYSRYELTSYEMVYEVIMLNIRALCLFVSGGSIDSRADKYLEEISSLYSSLYIFENKFKNTDVVPAGVRMVFENKCAQLKKILELGKSSKLNQWPVM